MTPTNIVCSAQSKPKSNTSKLLDRLEESTEREFEPIRLRNWDYIWLEICDEDRFFNAKIVAREAASPYMLSDENQFVQQTAMGNWVTSCNMRASYAAECWLVNKLPESYRAQGSDYAMRRIAATDYTALIINNVWPMDRIIFENVETKTFYEYLVARFLSQNNRAQIQAEFKIDGRLPAFPSDFEDHESLPLSDYQKVAMAMSLEQESTALYMEQGTGKTPTVISRICLEAKRHRIKTGKLYRAIIVCPNQVRINWQNEFSRFSTVPGRVTVLRGTQMRRLNLIGWALKPSDSIAFSAVIIGYDTLSSDVDILTQVSEWELGVCDESHYFKSNRTKRWKALKKLRPSCFQRMGLTGTPIANSMFDIWTQLEWLGEGLSGFSSLKGFMKFYGRFEETGQSATGGAVQKLLGYANLPLFQERLARLSFSITKEEAKLHLPDKVYDIYEVDMTPKQAALYKTLAEKLAAEIESEISGEVNALTVNHILTKLLRLAQICSGFIKWDSVVDGETGIILKEGKLEQISQKNPKLEAIKEIILDPETPVEEKTIIWATFVEDLQQVSRTLTGLGIDHVTYYGATTAEGRESAVGRFNKDPACRVMVANPQTAGEGLNLLGYDVSADDQTTYCGREVFYSCNWSMIQRCQAEDRAHRRGTKMPVRITDLVIPGTIDEEIRKRVKSKINVARTVGDIKEILLSILED